MPGIVGLRRCDGADRCVAPGRARARCYDGSMLRDPRMRIGCRRALVGSRPAVGLGAARTVRAVVGWTRGLRSPHLQLAVRG
jgi:hypothetical protein